MPRQDVYKTLNELFEIGLIEKKLIKPVEFRAIPVDRCLSLIIERRKKKNHEIEEMAKKIVIASPKKQVTIEREDSSQIILIPKKGPIGLKARDMINRAQKTICVISPHQKIYPWIFKDLKPLRKALARNVRIRFLTDSKWNEEQKQNYWLTQVSRHLPQIKYLPFPPNVSLGVYDSRELILELSANGGFLESEVIVTENLSLIDMAIKYFQLMWSQAEF
jgi:sugar-specific transcriptional regulator TrmB